jgi:hypothetical protein
MTLHDFSANGKSDSRARDIMSVQTFERLEDEVAIGCGNPLAVVPDFENPFPPDRRRQYG